MEIRDEDLASTVLELEERMPRRDIAAALGITEADVEEIASGYLPSADVADRLRNLAASPGAPPSPGSAKRVAKVSAGVIVAFVVADFVFFGLVAAFVLLR